MSSLSSIRSSPPWHSSIPAILIFVTWKIFGYNMIVFTAALAAVLARSLATDLDRMPGFVVQRARVFHMFPQSTHHEVLVQLARR